MRTANFSAAVTTALDDFIHKSLKDEQIECIRIISLEEAVLPLLPTAFGKSVTTGGLRYVVAIKYLLTYKMNYRNLKHKTNGRKRFRKGRFKRQIKANKTPDMNRLTFHLTYRSFTFACLV